MSVQRSNRAAAQVASYPTESAAGSELRAFPATPANDAKAGKPIQRNKKSTTEKAKAKKVSLQRSKPVMKQKPGAKRIARVSAAGNIKSAKKRSPSVRTDRQPHLLSTEKISVIASDVDMPLNMTAALAPVLVMLEEAPMEAAPMDAADMIAAEMISDDPEAYEQNAATDDHALASEATVLEPALTPAAGKSTFLQALALQWTSLLRILTQAWVWTYRKLKSHQVRKRLRICETVSLGDKRFIAVIQVNGEQFLVGGSSSSVSTLAHLEPRREFSDMFKDRCAQDLSQA